MSSGGFDAILYEDFTAPAPPGPEEDQRIERFAAGLDATILAGSIAYRNNEGSDLSDPVVTVPPLWVRLPLVTTMLPLAPLGLPVPPSSVTTPP